MLSLLRHSPGNPGGYAEEVGKLREFRLFSEDSARCEAAHTWLGSPNVKVEQVRSRDSSQRRRLVARIRPVWLARDGQASPSKSDSRTGRLLDFSRNLPRCARGPPSWAGSSASISPFSTISHPSSPLGARNRPVSRSSKSPRRTFRSSRTIRLRMASSPRRSRS